MGTKIRHFLIRGQDRKLYMIVAEDWDQAAAMANKSLGIPEIIDLDLAQKMIQEALEKITGKPVPNESAIMFEVTDMGQEFLERYNFKKIDGN